MIYLTLVIISVALCALFLFLTAHEARTGTRLLRQKREQLDVHASRVFFIIAHVDLAAFMRDLVREVGKRLAHDTAHLSLVFVRATERLLTRLVRALRTHKAESATTSTSASPFVRSMSDLKQKLRSDTDEQGSAE